MKPSLIIHTRVKNSKIQLIKDIHRTKNNSNEQYIVSKTSMTTNIDVFDCIVYTQIQKQQVETGTSVSMWIVDFFI